LLVDPDSAHVGLLEKPLSDFVGDRYALYMALAVRDRGIGYEQVFADFNSFRVLCAIRHGHRGVEGINAAAEQYLTKKGYDCLSKIWYPGRPVLITRNDYSLDLSNGDIGICLADPADGVLKVWFERPDGTLRNCLPYRLPPCETAYALTIHKCQGSEFDEVLVVLPEHENRILSRELIYTAVTRAKKRVLMATTKEMLQQALARRIDRFSGLKNRLQ
jgi:exodeoxyribonuclease V alpha subunit